MSSTDASAAAGHGRHALPQAERGSWFSRRRLAILLVSAALIAYYGAALGGLGGQDEHQVSLDVKGLSSSADRVDLGVQVIELDSSERTMKLQVQPVPQGHFAAGNSSELSEPAILQVSSPGNAPSNFDYPEDQALDAVSVSVALDSGAYGYPFDHPEGQVRMQMLTKDGEASIPLNVDLTNAANNWRMSGKATSNSGGLRLDLEAHRDMLIVSLAIFYLFAIGLTAIISVAIIGTSLTDGEVTFSEVIWLGAMLVAIPAIRNEMPGAPAIGTAIDVFVFFPAVGVIALTLLAATVVLASSKRSGPLEEDED